MIRKILDKYWFNRVFLFIILLIYALWFLFNYHWWILVGKYFLSVFFKSILPILLLVYFLIFIFNLFIDKKIIKEFFEKSSYVVRLFASVFGGIVSSGPVYLWYPLLKQFKQKWLTYGHIASFIYARAIKIPLIPMMIVFFWWKYTLIFNLVIFVLSFIIWIIIDLLA